MQRKEPIEALSSDVVINGADAYLSPLDWDRSRDKIHLELCHEWEHEDDTFTHTGEGRDVFFLNRF